MPCGLQHAAIFCTRRPCDAVFVSIALLDAIGRRMVSFYELWLVVRETRRGTGYDVEKRHNTWGHLLYHTSKNTPYVVWECFALGALRLERTQLVRLTLPCRVGFEEKFTLYNEPHGYDSSSPSCCPEVTV